MEYAIISAICLILGFLLSFFLYRNSGPQNNSGKSLEHLLELQKKDWEKNQLDFRGLVEPLKDNLKNLDKHIRELESKREGAYKSLGKELEQLSIQQKELQDSTKDLKNALRSSSTRGRWGEMKLKRIVELAGLQKHVDYDDQVTTQSDDSSIRPDMVVYLPNKGIIVIDSKAPLKAYLDSSEQDNPDIAKELLIKHAQATRAFMRSLHQKSYWSQFKNSPELVVMFVPLESALYSAFENDKDLFDDALKNKVLIVSSVSLLALLKAVSHGWINVEFDKNTQKIVDEGRKLYDRFNIFSLMFKDIGKKLKTAQIAYNKASSSMKSRVIPSMERFKEMGAGSAEIEEPDLLDIGSEEINEDEKTVVEE